MSNTIDATLDGYLANNSVHKNNGHPRLLKATKLIVKHNVNTEKVYLLASQALGDNHATADYDILVVVDQHEEETMRAIHSLKEVLIEEGVSKGFSLMIRTTRELETTEDLQFWLKDYGVILYNKEITELYKKINESVADVTTGLDTGGEAYPDQGIDLTDLPTTQQGEGQDA